MSKFYKSKTIYEPIYEMYLTFVVSNDRVKLANKDGLDFFENYGQTSKTPKQGKRGYRIVICLEEGLTIHQVINTIGHESDHASGFIMEDIDEEPRWTSEPKAYLTGFICEKLSKILFANAKLVLKTK